MRVVGDQPAKQPESSPTLTKDMPKDMTEGLAAAQRSNPALLASIENVRSAYAAAARDAAHQPPSTCACSATTVATQRLRWPA
ncbi:MAG: hypothetical protein M5R42_16100 [Rhodocyclaceae bacterium]|nr:hypothetical protein [Rhodocyclaceae bacterium]